MPSSRSTAPPTACADLRGQRDEPLARTGDEPDGDVDPPVADADPDRRAAERVAPARSAATDPQHARDLEGGEPDGLADDARARRDQRRTSGVGLAAVRSRPARTRSSRQPGGSGAAAAARPRRAPRRSARGTRSRAVVAPTRTACSIIRRRARPWVMITAPAHAQQRRAADDLVVEHRADPADARAQQQVREAAPDRRRGTRRAAWSKMNPDRPSKNLITTLPRTASVTRRRRPAASVRSLPSTLPTKLRSVSSISSVARWIRASPLPFSSPIESSATRGPVHAQDALAEDRAHARVLGEVLRRWSRGWRRCRAARTAGPCPTIWIARPGRSTPGRRAQDAGRRPPCPRRCGPRSRPRRPRRFGRARWRRGSSCPSSRAGRAPGARPCR